VPFHRFEGLEAQQLNPHLSTGRGRTIEGRYMYFRTVHKDAGTGSELHYHPNELMIFPLAGKLNAVVGKERRIVPPGTFVHCPPNARHSMRATEDGDVDYLYIKDRTWTLIGFAADEALPDRAPTPDEIASAHKAGKWPGGKKEPEKSQAIIEGLGQCYYPILDSLQAPPASGRREHWVAGARLAFGFVEAHPGEKIEEADRTGRETFIYVLSGKLDATVAGERKTAGAGDIVQIPKGAAASITVAGPDPARYCAVRSTPALEAAVDKHGASNDKG
jgi:quercetin dioxygenase-like cupin family protein